MARYTDDPAWADITPLEQDDGEGALAQIAYSEEYAEAMGYLRAVMTAKEHTPRVLALTKHIIALNPAHYTVWLYRATTIFALNSPLTPAPLNAELAWLDEVALENEKNYQIWHHRQLLIDKLFPLISEDDEEVGRLATRESRFMVQMFNADSKNYHVWSYRQYLVRKLSMWGEAEIKAVELLIDSDVRNNSAWSHRFFIVFSDPAYTTPNAKATESDVAVPAEVIDREVCFAQQAAHLAPQNQSPWNYLRGVLRKSGRPLASCKTHAEEFVGRGWEEGGVGDGRVKSSYALEFLVDVWAEEGDVESARRGLERLGDTWDVVRKNYWDWRIVLLPVEGKMEMEGLGRGVEGVEVGA